MRRWKCVTGVGQPRESQSEMGLLLSSRRALLVLYMAASAGPCACAMACLADVPIIAHYAALVPVAGAIWAALEWRKLSARHRAALKMTVQYRIRRLKKKAVMYWKSLYWSVPTTTTVSSPSLG